METRTALTDDKAATAMPRRLRRSLLAALAIAFAGALYLITVRGEALLLDLSALGQRVFCF